MNGSDEGDASRVWLVTGASGGLGRCLVEQVLGEGERVVAATRRPSRLSDLAERFPGRMLPVEVDVTDPGQIQAVVDRTVHRWGRIDVVVSNAGSGLIGGLEECSRDQIGRSIAVNLMGPIDLMRAALPVMRRLKAGHIIMVGAAAAISNYPGFSVYGGAKAAVEFVAESLRAEVSHLGIRVSVVQPGPLRTPFLTESLEVADSGVQDYVSTVGRFRSLLGRMDGRQPGDPVRAAEAILTLSREPHPPFRLVLGRYALEKSRKTLAARTAELEAREAAALSVDFVRPTA